MSDEPRSISASVEDSENTPASAIDAPSENVPVSDDDAPDVAQRLQKANAQAARYRVERNSARAELESLQAEVESLTQRVTEAEETAQQASLKQWQASALAEHGLPQALADRLQGDSPEAIAEDAARLAKLFPLRRNSRTGHSSPDPAPTRAEQIFARIEGRADDVFSLLLQSNLGGGTFEVKRDDG